jgi:hypothetical protein
MVNSAAEFESNIELKDDEVQQFMQYMDVVDIERRKSAAAQEQLSFEDRQEKIKAGLRETYAKMGKEVTNAQLEAAVESYTKKRWEFIPPTPGWKGKLVDLYINRNWIATRILLPIAIASTLLFGGVQLGKATIRAQKQREESSVEQRVSNSYSTEKRLEAKLDELSGSDIARQLPSREKTSFNSNLDEGRTILRENAPFFDKYCPLGKPQQAVTKENYQDVSGRLKKVDSALSDVNNKVNTASKLIQEQKSMIFAKQSLDKTFESLKGTAVPTMILNQAQRYYNEGLASLERRNLPGIRSAESSILALTRDASEIATLPKTIKGLYDSAITLAREKKAVDLADKIYADSKTASETADIARLKADSNQLGDLVNILSKEYTITIASKPKSYVTRYYTAHATGERTVSGYYVIAEARENGRPISMNVEDSEDNNRVKTVMQWGEEVPLFIYEEVKADKKDGVVDNNRFATKEKGYLTEKTEFTSREGRKLQQRGKKITQW